MGGRLRDRLLTVGVFYSQQKQAICDTWAPSRSDTVGTRTREGKSVVHQEFTDPPHPPLESSQLTSAGESQVESMLNYIVKMNAMIQKEIPRLHVHYCKFVMGDFVEYLNSV